MYGFYWMFLVIISIWISLIAFIWGLKSGQFSDQNRVRYLPLRDLSTTAPSVNPEKLSTEAYVLLGIAASCLIIFLLPVFLTFLH